MKEIEKKINSCNQLIDAIIDVEESFNGIPKQSITKALNDINSIRAKLEIKLENQKP